jgi:quinol monooxygenase YgiN
MVIVIAKVSVKPECKQELLTLAKTVIAATNAEEGCISYILLDNPYDPGSCMFVEEWASLDALRTHAASSHIGEWRRQSKDLLSAKTTVTVYQGEKAVL